MFLINIYWQYTTVNISNVCHKYIFPRILYIDPSMFEAADKTGVSLTDSSFGYSALRIVPPGSWDKSALSQDVMLESINQGEGDVLYFIVLIVSPGKVAGTFLILNSYTDISPICLLFRSNILSAGRVNSIINKWSIVMRHIIENHFLPFTLR